MNRSCGEERACLLVQEWTALHFAAKWGFLDIAQALLEAGADITGKQMVSWQLPVRACSCSWPVANAILLGSRFILAAILCCCRARRERRRRTSQSFTRRLKRQHTCGAGRRRLPNGQIPGLAEYGQHSFVPAIQLLQHPIASGRPWA
jgi:ankyrin repeat protein